MMRERTETTTTRKMILCEFQWSESGFGGGGGKLSSYL